MARKKSPKRGKFVSLREIARIAGVSPATVSLAMKESPRLAEATKERIRKIAKQHGYRPNPLLSRILAETVTSRYQKRGGLIYLVMTRYTPENWDPTNPCFLALSNRCRELGYALEPFWIFEPGMSPARANKIMYSRGVDGLIIHPPRYELRSGQVLTLPIEWEKFCVVEIDDVITEPVLHHVRHDHLSAIWLALQEMEALGYRRIGFCLSPEVDFATHHRWTAGYSYWAETRGLGDTPLRTPLMYEGDPRAVREWIQSNRLDAVIGPSMEILAAIRAAGVRVPGEVAYAALDRKDASNLISAESVELGATRDSEEEIAGILQCRLEQYSLAADMIASLIARGALGIPAVSSAWILDGKWQPGATCPPKESSSQAGSASGTLAGGEISPRRKLPKEFRKMAEVPLSEEHPEEIPVWML